MRFLLAFVIVVVLFQVTKGEKKVGINEKSKSINNVTGKKTEVQKRTKSNKKGIGRKKIRNSGKKVEKKQNIKGKKIKNNRMKKIMNKRMKNKIKRLKNNKKGWKKKLKRKKLKEMKKTLENKKRKMDIAIAVKRQNNSCTTIECLNSIVAVLKINKDQAENYLKQNRRIKRMMDLAGM